MSVSVVVGVEWTVCWFCACGWSSLIFRVLCVARELDRVRVCPPLWCVVWRFLYKNETLHALHRDTGRLTTFSLRDLHLR